MSDFMAMCASALVALLSIGFVWLADRLMEADR